MVSNMALRAELEKMLTVEQFDIELEIISLELLSLGATDESAKLAKLLPKLDTEMQKCFLELRKKEVKLEEITKKLREKIAQREKKNKESEEQERSEIKRKEEEEKMLNNKIEKKLQEVEKLFKEREYRIATILKTSKQNPLESFKTHVENIIAQMNDYDLHMVMAVASATSLKKFDKQMNWEIVNSIDALRAQVNSAENIANGIEERKKAAQQRFNTDKRQEKNSYSNKSLSNYVPKNLNVKKIDKPRPKRNKAINEVEATDKEKTTRVHETENTKETDEITNKILNETDEQKTHEAENTKETDEITNKILNETDEQKIHEARSEKENYELEVIKNKYPEIFNNTPSKGYKGIECAIPTAPNQKVIIKQRPIPQSMLEGTRKSIKKLEENGYIEPSNSSWCNPIRPVLKPDGTVRITENLQFLNNLVEDDKYSLPDITRILENTSGSKIFSVIDCKDGYYQIKLKKEDRYKTAFQFENKLYQWTRLIQGYKNAPALFQRIMDKEFNNGNEKICEIYLDDIIIHGKNEEEHDKNFHAVIEIFDKIKFKINLEKIQYKKAEVKVLGAIINGITKKPIPEKQKRILEFEQPKSKKELMRFIGFANYYRKYIEHFAEKAVPLYEALKTKNKEITWNAEQERAFNLIKNAINKDIVTYLPDFNKEFIISTDASNTGLGAVLQQKNDKGEHVVIDWASKKLSEAEKKLGITEKEFLAMAWGITHFDYYLRGRKFEVVTDHTALKAMKSKAVFGSIKLERMREKLQEYNFIITYRKGTELIEADAISRIHENSDVKEKTKIKPTEQELFENLKPKMVQENQKWFYKSKTGELKEYPDPREHQNIIKSAHERLNHKGRDVVYYELTKHYYWPNLKKGISEYLKKCETCIVNKQKTNGGEKFIKTSEPLEIVGTDLITVDHNTYILTFKDFYTRKIDCLGLNTKQSIKIKDAMEHLILKNGIPKTIVTDPGLEFNNAYMKRLLGEYNITHHVTSTDKSQSNGRIERLHRDIWQFLRKENYCKSNEDINEQLEKFTKAYNNSYHRGIKCTPNEAWDNPKEYKLKNLNESESKYGKEFKMLNREKFKENQEVFIERSKNISNSKMKTKYENKGLIYKKLDNDSYLIKNNDRILKRNHAQLVAIHN